MRAVIPVLLVAGIVIVAMGVYIHHLRKTLRGIDNPLVFLSSRERRAHARELLEREKQRYEAEQEADQQKRLTQIIWNNGTEDT
jgi:hypothetical protein